MTKTNNTVGYIERKHKIKLGVPSETLIIDYLKKIGFSALSKLIKK